ncbi:MAG TPA: hypothetical protein VK639_12410, partial [Terriglobales bacterium]|nr:hypothetical protein [Terriglobales bacterium]
MRSQPEPALQQQEQRQRASWQWKKGASADRYMKFWDHKFHAMVFAEAIVRGVRRLASEGLPVSNPTIENE